MRCDKVGNHECVADVVFFFDVFEFVAFALHELDGVFFVALVPSHLIPTPPFDDGGVDDGHGASLGEKVCVESGLDDDHLPLHLVFDGNVDAAAMVARRNDFVHLPENGGNDIFGEDASASQLDDGGYFWPLGAAVEREHGAVDDSGIYSDADDHFARTQSAGRWVYIGALAAHEAYRSITCMATFAIRDLGTNGMRLAAYRKHTRGGLFWRCQRAGR